MGSLLNRTKEKTLNNFGIKENVLIHIKSSTKLSLRDQEQILFIFLFNIVLKVPAKAFKY